MFKRFLHDFSNLSSLASQKLPFHTQNLRDFQLDGFGISTVSAFLGTFPENGLTIRSVLPNFGDFGPFLSFWINVGNLGSSSVYSFQALTSSYYKMASITLGQEHLRTM